MKDFKAVIVTVNQEEFGLDINHVISIETMKSYTAVPTSVNYVKGIVTIRGIVTPIIDLRIALGKEEISDTDSTRIVVINLEGEPIGLLVDEATDVLDISYESIRQINLINDIDFIHGVSQLEDRLLILIDVHKMLQNMDGLDDLKKLNLNQLKEEVIAN